MLVGVLQRSMLYPMLYTLYTSDISKYIRTKLSVYSYDICVYDKKKSAINTPVCSTPSPLNLEGCAAELQINIASENTKAVAFIKKKQTTIAPFQASKCYNKLYSKFPGSHLGSKSKLD